MTESSDTGRDPLLRFCAKVVRPNRFELVWQILFAQLFRHLSNRGTKVPASPKVPSPVWLFQYRKLFEQLAGDAAFDPAHELARRHIGRGRDEDEPMILADDPLWDLGLDDLTGLPDQLPHTERNIPGEDLVTVLGDPDNMVLDVAYGVTAISIIHSTSIVGGCGGLLYALRNSGDEICPPEGGSLNLANRELQL